MKKICTIILLAAILCNLCGCGLLGFFHDTNKKTFASWQPELSLPLAIVHFRETIYTADKEIEIGEMLKTKEFVRPVPICLHGNILYFVVDSVSEEDDLYKWTLYSIDINNSSLVEITSYKYSVYHASLTGMGVYAYYESDKIHIYDNDRSRTVVYDIKTAEIGEKDIGYFSQVYQLSYEKLNASQTLSLSLDGETRELTMERLLSEHPLMQTTEKILEKSLHEPVFIGMFFIDGRIYFSCAIYDEHGFASSLLFYYDWMEDRCYFLDYSYLPLGSEPNYINYFPIPII